MRVKQLGMFILYYDAVFGVGGIDVAAVVVSVTLFNLLLILLFLPIAREYIFNPAPDFIERWSWSEKFIDT